VAWHALQTFSEADLAGDDIISLEEWQTLVSASPNIIGYMTLPVLKEARRLILPSPLSCLLHEAPCSQGGAA
jgi:hypothetical protein